MLIRLNPYRYPGLSLINRWKQHLSLAQVFLVVALVLPPGPFLFQSAPPPFEPDISIPIQSSSALNASESAGCGGSYPSPVNSTYEQEIIKLVNAARVANNLPPLRHVDLLDQAARYHAKDMQQDDYFFHETYDRINGILSYICDFDVRISTFYPNWSWLGENILLGGSSPQDAMNTWMNSPAHRANILSTYYREIGVGYYTGYYWVLDFGQRPKVYPIVINNEDTETDTRDVSLYIYGSPAYWIEMRLRNDAQEWSSWTPFQNTKSWQLPDTAGDHTVSVELRRGAITASSNDSIYLSKASLAQLGNLPSKLTFTYSTVDRRFIPDHFSLKPLNIGGGSILNWEIQSTGNWFGVSPWVGSAPDTFTITPLGSYTKAGLIYNGLVTVDVTSPNGTVGSPHQIEVSLNIVDIDFKEIHLPFIVTTP